MIILKNCPCCGGEATLHTNTYNGVFDSGGTYVHVECDDCKLKGEALRTSLFKTIGTVKRQVTKAWNKREGSY